MKSGLKVRTSVKAGGIGVNHNRKSGLKVRSGMQGGGLATANHIRNELTL